jgi:hypothetical protein
MSYNDKQDTNSEYQSEAFQKAKFANGIPASKQPVNNGQPEKIADRNNPGKFCYQYEFKNDYGEEISIRLDNPVDYNDSNSNQAPHYNAGKKGDKLKQHHYFKKYNT